MKMLLHRDFVRVFNIPAGISFHPIFICTVNPYLEGGKKLKSKQSPLPFRNIYIC